MDEAVDGGEVGDGSSLSLLTTRIVDDSTSFRLDGCLRILHKLDYLSVWDVRAGELDSVSNTIWSNRCQTVWPQQEPVKRSIFKEFSRQKSIIQNAFLKYAEKKGIYQNVDSRHRSTTAIRPVASCVKAATSVSFLLSLARAK